MTVITASEAVKILEEELDTRYHLSERIRTRSLCLTNHMEITGVPDEHVTILKELLQKRGYAVRVDVGVDNNMIKVLW